MPYLYAASTKARAITGKPCYKHAPRVDKIRHDIVVLDTAIYYQKKYGLELKEIKSEKDLQGANGFGKRRHEPDFTFAYKGKRYCVEVELAHKSKKRIEANARQNYLNYDYQMWVMPEPSLFIYKELTGLQKKYPNVIILDWLTMENDG